MATAGLPLLEVAAQIGATKLKLIIDTGASISILPTKYAVGLSLQPTAVTLTSASGETIPCHGESSVDIQIRSLRRTFTWTFVIADTTHPLLGMDFLAHHDLLVNCKNSELIDKTTKTSITAKHPTSEVVQVIINDKGTLPDEVGTILNKYPSVTSTKSTHSLPSASKVTHSIDTGDAKPTYAKTRQLSAEKFAAAKNEFQNLLQAGIIRQSKSPWSSPLHLVPKSEANQFRPCGDYRTLNAITKPDRYPIPHIHSVSTKLNKMKYFSKIDLVKAYHQIPLQECDIEKTAVCTPFGLYEYLYMPFGLRNAGATFQRYMDNIFMDTKCVFIYLDDILIFSETKEQHLIDLEEVLKILHSNNLRISLPKCSFIKENIDFLGCNITCQGIKPPNNKVSEINQYPEPTDSKSLRRFLGMVGFYRRLIPNFAQVVIPLTETIKKNPNEKKLMLTTEAKEAFKEIKLILANLSVLSHPSAAATHYQLVTDSSSYAVGAALHQIIDSKPVPIGFFSKKLTEAQRKYSTFDRELLAAFLAVLHFKPQIEGRQVTLFTDHKPLVSAYKKTSLLKSDKQQRHLSIITEYVADIAYIRGDQNIVADCLSRPANAVTVDIYDLPALAEQQKNDQEIESYKERLKPFKLNSDTILCDTSTPYPRPFVPLDCRKNIFNSLHDISHPGIKSTLKLIKARYFWPNQDRDIRTWTKECLNCQQAKINRHTKSSIQPFNLPSSRFETVHMDIVGPLTPARYGDESYSTPYRYILTCIDRATRWIEAIPMTNITASTVAISFIEAWVSRFGVPLHVISDRGSQFESELFQELSTLVGFHRLRTTAYHPQCNGMIERQHRTIKTAIMARKQNWLKALPIVLLSLRNIPTEAGFTPSTAVTGSSVLYPRPLVDNTTEDNFTSSTVRELAVEMSKINFDKLSEGRLHSTPKTYEPDDLRTCTHVWIRIDRVRRPLEAPYSGPHEVYKRFPKYFKIITNSGDHQNVSIDRLKPVHAGELLPGKEKQTQDSSDPDTTNASTDPEALDEDANEESTAEEDAPTRGDAAPETVVRQSKRGRTITFKSKDDYYYY